MIKYLMYILLLWLNLSTTRILADTYIIKLATYSEKQNLIKKITGLEPTLQSRLIIIRENNLYKLFSHTTEEKSNLLKLLPSYQKIFPDAFIKTNYSPTIEKNKINFLSFLNKESNHSNAIETTSIIKSTSIVQPITSSHHVSHSLYQLLNNKTYYLCPNKIHSKSEKLLIQADFNTTDVNFTTIIGKVPPLHMPYMIQKNRLYFINNGHISPSQFSTLDKIYFEYMVISRWMKGKKIHQMRYYNKKDDAKSYLDSIYIP